MRKKWPWVAAVLLLATGVTFWWLRDGKTEAAPAPHSSVVASAMPTQNDGPAFKTLPCPNLQFGLKFDASGAWRGEIFFNPIAPSRMTLGVEKFVNDQGQTGWEVTPLALSKDVTPVGVVLTDTSGALRILAGNPLDTLTVPAGTSVYQFVAYVEGVRETISADVAELFPTCHKTA